MKRLTTSLKSMVLLLGLCILLISILPANLKYRAPSEKVAVQETFPPSSKPTPNENLSQEPADQSLVLDNH